MAFLADLVAILVLAFWAWRRGRDLRVAQVSAARRLRMAALIPLALEMGIFLLFGLGEMAGGDWSGAGHLLELGVLALLAGLAWMRPLEGGVTLLLAGAFSAASFIVSFLSAAPQGDVIAISPAMMILALPSLLSGALFLAAGLVARRGDTAGA